AGPFVQALAGAPPDGFVSGADVEHPPRVGGGDPEDVGDVLGELAETLLRLLQLALGPLAAQELPDQAAEGAHQLQQVGVRLADFVAEELDDAQELAAHGYGAAERPVQPFAGRRRRPREVVVPGHVGDPGGSATRPGAAGQALAGPEAAPPAGPLERGGAA